MIKRKNKTYTRKSLKVKGNKNLKTDRISMLANFPNSGGTVPVNELPSKPLKIVVLFKVLTGAKTNWHLNNYKGT